ncbi:MAG: potassium transporter Kup [Nevskiaceae bacterium]
MRSASPRSVTPALVIGAIGSVFGDVGTSPLYALRAVMQTGLNPLLLPDVLGVLSLIFWAIALVVGLKYVAIVLRADNDGEGGVLALTQLALARTHFNIAGTLSAMGLIGCALFFGDGVITPAISVLSAVEGLELVAPSFEGVVVPLALGILLALFVIQKKGTTRIGRAFGPIMVTWFLVLAALGAHSILQTPEVLVAINPRYALELLYQHPLVALAIFGAAFLCVTGGEALYADLGHFGRKAITRGWLLLVWPALLLNYFGQGALLLRDATAIQNPFFLLAPRELLLPLVCLATAATVIASQAVISGVFSITRQCEQLGLLPRMRIVHSSEQAIGQVYVPFINWMLCLTTLMLVIGFGSSSALAGAYGVGVSITMALDSILMFALLLSTTPRYRSALMAVIVFVLLIELGFIAGNLLKLPDGGWVPLALGLLLFFVMATWRQGRSVLAAKVRRDDFTLPEFQRLIDQIEPAMVEKTAVYLASDSTLVPRALVRNVQLNRVLHAQTVLLTVQTATSPRVLAGSRTRVQELLPGVYRIVCTVGFMDHVDVPALMQEARRHFKDLELKGALYIVGRDDIVTSRRPGMTRIQKALFAFMSRNAELAGSHFGIPAERILESGRQVEI